MNETVYYIVNGRRYSFRQLHIECGVLRGYCTRLKAWASLFDTYFHVDSGPVFKAAKMG